MRKTFFLIVLLSIVIIPNAYAAITVSITSPANHSSFTWPVNNITINVSASAGNYTITRITYFRDSTVLCDKYDGASNMYNCTTWNNPGVGDYTLTAKAYTSIGSAISAPVYVSVKAPNPTVSITSPANNSSSIQPANIILTAYASTAYGYVTKVEYYEGSNLIGISSSASSSYKYTWKNVSTGNYGLSAKVYTNYGYTAGSSPVYVSVYTAPNFISFDNQCRNNLP